ncbi:MAG: efflux RND transporter permease subunit, partial [Candidatus Hydrogenedentes bacterium]|nr:efflux RND transporter permease subunit [Candidatus Hydrogenedentota bacterium]
DWVARMTESPETNQKTYRLPIRRPVTTAMIFVTLIVFGWKSYQELPINLMPDISYPTLTVRTEYEGAAPEDVEKLLTRPLEETLSIVSGLVEISSTSSAGSSEIVMEFTWDTDMSVAQQDVRDRLDLFDPPKDVTEKPVILRYDPTLDPVLRVAIAGSDPTADLGGLTPEEKERRELLEIRQAAEEQIKSELEGKRGIAQVLVKGGCEEEIQVLVDSARLKNLGLSFETVSNALAQQNVNLSGGQLRDGKTEYLVRIVNEYADVAEIGETPLGVFEGAQIRLNDVATVTVGERERETVVRMDGRESVELEIYKWGDANTVQVCDMLKDLFEFERPPTLGERLKKLFALPEGEPPAGAPPELVQHQLAKQMALTSTIRSRLPEYAQIQLISDQSRFIVASIKEVQNTAIVGGILALIILYFFLRELRSTIVIGVSIPISIVATFIPMFLRDVTLNIMSLGGLALGVGMLVDNSIVVLESIFRCTEEGDGTVDAANRGTQEVASAVTASTLTTIAVFLPLAFVEGVAGQLFRDQALTVTFSLIASLLVALFLIPMLASRQRVKVAPGQEVIWILRGYREARAVRGAGRLAGLGAIVPNAVRYAWEWFSENAAETVGPCLRFYRHAALRAGDRKWHRRALVAGVAYAAISVAVLIGVYVGYQSWKGPDAARTALLTGFCVVPLLPVAAAGIAVAGPIGAVLLVFGFHVGIKAFGTALATVFFFVSVAAMSVYWVLAKILGALFWIPLKVFDVTFRAFTEAYVVVLRHSLRFSPAILLVVVLLSLHAGYVALSLGRELIPPMKQGEFSIRMEAPPGTRLEDTEQRARAIEKIVLETPEVGTVAVQVGQEKTKAEADRGENVAEFTVLLRDPDKDARHQDAIIEGLRRKIARVSSDAVTFALPSLFSFKTAVELQIRGDELDVLKAVGQRAVAAIADVPGLEDVELSLREGYPEIIIELDRDLCAAYNIDPDQIARRLHTEVQGDKPTQFSRHGNKIDIRVRADRRRLQSVHDLRTLSVKEGHPPIPLESVAMISVQDGPSEVRRIDQRQVAMVTGNVEGRDLGSVSEDIERRLRGVEKPLDYQFVLGGQNRELATSLSSLQFALLLAIFLVYIVMACQFESVWQPAMVMFAVPLAFIGVVYVLAGLAIDLSIVVYIGGIILAGIVVNDAIVLVDYVNQLRARGMSKREAVIQAGRVRLRPILMTTLTTVLGLIPMAMWAGEGAEIRQPMAITVMAGLSSATVLTLIIIPMIYDLFGGRDRA